MGSDKQGADGRCKRLAFGHGGSDSHATHSCLRRPNALGTVLLTRTESVGFRPEARHGLQVF